MLQGVRLWLVTALGVHCRHSWRLREAGRRIQWDASYQPLLSTLSIAIYQAMSLSMTLLTLSCREMKEEEKESARADES